MEEEAAEEEARRTSREVQIQKQEPHTMMWGKRHRSRYLMVLNGTCRYLTVFVVFHMFGLSTCKRSCKRD